MQKISKETIKQYLYIITYAKEEYRDYKVLNTYNYIYKRGVRRIYSINPYNQIGKRGVKRLYYTKYTQLYI